MDSEKLKCEFLNLTFRFLQKLKNLNKTLLSLLFNETKVENKRCLLYIKLVPSRSAEANMKRL